MHCWRDHPARDRLQLLRTTITSELPANVPILKITARTSYVGSAENTDYVHD